MVFCESPRLQEKLRCSKQCLRTKETKDLIELPRCSGGTGRKQSFPNEPCLLAVNPLEKSRGRNNRLCSLRFSEEPGKVISMTFASRARPSSLRLTREVPQSRILPQQRLPKHQSKPVPGMQLIKPLPVRLPLLKAHWQLKLLILHPRTPHRQKRFLCCHGIRVWNHNQITAPQ